MNGPGPAVRLAAVAAVAPDAGVPVPAGWFDPVAHLGPRGWRYTAPAGRHLLAAARRAAAGWPAAEAGTAGLDAGVVVGSEHGLTGVHERFAGVLRDTGVRGLRPAELPMFSAHTPAVQVAIELGLRGFATTLTDPVVAGLAAVREAARAVRGGRARRVLAAATEEPPPGHDGPTGACALAVEAGPGPGPRVVGGWAAFDADGWAAPQARERLAGRLAALLAALPPGGRTTALVDGGRTTDPAADLAADLAGRTGALVRPADAALGTVSGLLALSATRTGAVLAVSPLGHAVAVAVAGTADDPDAAHDAHDAHGGPR